MRDGHERGREQAPSRGSTSTGPRSCRKLITALNLSQVQVSPDAVLAGSLLLVGSLKVTGQLLPISKRTQGECDQHTSGRFMASKSAARPTGYYHQPAHLACQGAFCAPQTDQQSENTWKLMRVMMNPEASGFFLHSIFSRFPLSLLVFPSKWLLMGGTGSCSGKNQPYFPPAGCCSPRLTLGMGI